MFEKGTTSQYLLEKLNRKFLLLKKNNPGKSTKETLSGIYTCLEFSFVIFNAIQCFFTTDSSSNVKDTKKR